MVVLAGVSGRLAGVREALGRNLFELPRGHGVSLFDRWRESLDSRCQRSGLAMPVCVAVDQSAPAALGELGPNVSMSRDAEETRGTAGVLRDLTRGYADDDHVLVTPASELTHDVDDAEWQALLEDPSDIVILADRDLRPVGPMRFRSGLLKRIPSVGFVDLKEQFLARCVGTASIKVVRCDRGGSGSLHNLRSYLAVVHPAASSQPEATAEAWRSDRALVEAGASVAPDAILFDSVILKGARIDSGAVVVRSLVGPSGHVRAGVEVVDSLVVGHSAVGEVTW